jgi:hypothetical protein
MEQRHEHIDKQLGKRPGDNNKMTKKIWPQSQWVENRDLCIPQKCTTNGQSQSWDCNN